MTSRKYDTLLIAKITRSTLVNHSCEPFNVGKLARRLPISQEELVGFRQLQREFHAAMGHHLPLTKLQNLGIW